MRPSTRLALLVLALAACTPASAHRYCTRVDDAGKAVKLVPDLKRPEFRIVEESTDKATGERNRYVLYDGGSTPICPVEECERYMAAMHIPLQDKYGTKLRAFCEEH